MLFDDAPLRSGVPVADGPPLAGVPVMAIRVVEFSSRVFKIGNIFS